MSEYAYMRDLTERGQGYDLESISTYIYFDEPKQQQSEQHPQQENQQNNDSQTSVDT